MALFDREFIASPDDHKGQIVYKHPDINIRRFSRAIVNVDQQALFVNKGHVVATLGPGQHKIDADEIPGLGVLIDNIIAKNVYRAELYFVSTKEFVDEPFGGRIDDVFDPQTKQVVSLRVFGEYSMRAIDPAAIVTNLVGSVNCEDNATITDWVDQLLLKTMKVDVTRNIVRHGWPIMGLSAYIPEIEASVIAAANEELATYGLALVRMGNFDINLSDEDLGRLKKYANDVVYTQLAGNYTDAARAEMMRGAGEGMAKGGAGVSGAFLAAGLGVGALTLPGPGPGAGAGAPPAASSAAVFGAAFPEMVAGAACGACGTACAPGAKFCGNCGTATRAAIARCTNCDGEVAVGAKFCSDCGTAVAA